MQFPASNGKNYIYKEMASFKLRLPQSYIIKNHVQLASVFMHNAGSMFFTHYVQCQVKLINFDLPLREDVSHIRVSTHTSRAGMVQYRILVLQTQWELFHVDFITAGSTGVRWGRQGVLYSGLPSLGTRSQRCRLSECPSLTQCAVSSRGGRVTSAWTRQRSGSDWLGPVWCRDHVPRLAGDWSGARSRCHTV